MSESHELTKPRPKPRPSDFRFGKEIGHGSFSTVYVAREIATNAEYAIKVVEKQHVCRNRAVDSVHMEKEVLRRTNHVFIIRLHYTFQDTARLFYVLEYAPRGELLQQLNHLTLFDVPCTRFYTAELLVALNYLHDQSIVHRDVKPENILLTDRMHIKLADFGSAIILNDPKVKAPTFTGTPEYVSPEMISSVSAFGEENSGDEPARLSHSSSSKELAYLMDYWALGCVIYQLISGRPPFRAEKNTLPYGTFQKIINLEYTFMDGFDSVAKDLVQRLIVINPEERLGSPRNGGPRAVMTHRFFAGVDWDTLPDQIPPILVPNLEPVAPVGWDHLPAGLREGEQCLLSSELGLFADQVSDSERSRLLSLQEKHNPYHRFVRNRLIIKQSILFKRRGLFASKRMFILTEGPHLFYVDLDSMSLKGEVPFSSFLTVELKSDKLFFIHVPNRTFFLEDPSGQASDWVKQITAIKRFYFASTTAGPSSSSVISENDGHTVIST
ncbi:unnamed protein product [Calicophoron daubneyi]|uniref:3-phosphoinositide-dependent protein kinase 1 n=1 Tax=Calicophoron daubneyi TaxID=300641 RepID=A0AAV2T694_CALDB